MNSLTKRQKDLSSKMLQLMAFYYLTCICLQVTMTVSKSNIQWCAQVSQITMKWLFNWIIVSSRVGSPPFLRDPLRLPFLGTPCFWCKFIKLPPSFWEPPPPPSFWVPPSFWCKFKKLTPFWEPSKLVHASCKNTLK